MGRMDRDEFITVYKHNVEPKMWHNFEEKDGLASAPYDYLSIMQYGKTAFGKYLNGKYALTMETIDKCYEDLIGKARHLSYYDHKAMNSVYGCSKECYATPCGKNCYATKSGENSDCHCVCLDHSNNPCKGGSCFIGDEYPNCAELVAKNPSLTCYNHGAGGKIDEKCCGSCKGVVIDSECPKGNTAPNCDDLIIQHGKELVCNQIRQKCCSSCKGVEIDPECPKGDYFSNCAEAVQTNPSHYCSQSRRDKCCKSCKGISKGNGISGISKGEGKGISVDARCPEGDTHGAKWCKEMIIKNEKNWFCNWTPNGRRYCCSSCL